MMWLLVVIVMGGRPSVAISMHEMSSQQTCMSAAEAINADKLPLVSVYAKCVKQ